MNDKKMYTISAVWRRYRARKQTIKTAVILADNKKEAIDIFNKEVTYPDDAHISTYEISDGIYTMQARDF